MLKGSEMHSYNKGATDSIVFPIIAMSISISISYLQHISVFISYIHVLFTVCVYIYI